MDILKQLNQQLIVSCQALDDEPLHSSFIMGRMAIAAKEGGAKGIRANSVVDINEIKANVDLPVIGIIKRNYKNSKVYITPTAKEVDELLTTEVEIIALDATKQDRPNCEQLTDLLARIHEAHRLAMADISTLEEAIDAQAKGFDFISTTLAGYTPYTTKIDQPDFNLLKAISGSVDVPTIMEGHINEPEQVTKALNYGAFATVVGSIITRPQLITKNYVEAAKKGERL
ncbi:N-acetylmannosamine-6-phosphate 2-epimerase [Tetragenococcus halophilus]|uniref:N-acetylmannosamine-6-phosphate 2-epimerase n=1 Tax=Tetragenococcus halophilus TaxID=51669 RepID=UPI00209B7C21|nr:N-acetylmannosamine-6-phosphate 2-epimerase [Tetragenococcus halophilus]MDN6724282.1 N-acetylmannosamine-6-phosphate 2-epimerase [Tetragenococcus halophilus]